jgi:hypothetical protein
MIQRKGNVFHKKSTDRIKDCNTKIVEEGEASQSK